MPWVSAWSREQSLPSRFVRHVNRDAEERLGYADEHASDRRNGVLWVRMSVARGRGRPDFAGLHPLRQRQAMAHLLCQVCGSTTVGTREDERHLFVFVAREVVSLHEVEPITLDRLAHEARTARAPA